MIKEGRITLNGKIVSRLGTKVNPEIDYLKIDGKLIKLKKSKIYIALNKPKGYLTTSFDEKNRPTIYSLLKDKINMWIFPVGRLDYNSEGLLLLTNDGDMSRFLTMPENSVKRVYEVKLQGMIDQEDILRLNKGIRLEDGWVSSPKVRFLKKAKANYWVEVSMRSGKNREVRRIFKKIGYNVLKLKRVKFGPIALGDLKPGEFRYLTSGEVSSLKQMTKQKILSTKY